VAKFPEPSNVDTLQRIAPVTVQLAAGTLITRIYFAGGPYPVDWNTFRHFGPTASRFDHHLPGPEGETDGRMQSRGILYAAMGSQAFPTCLAEVFQSVRTIDRRVHDPVLVYFRMTATLDLLDLTGTFATRIGASMAINSGPRPRARRWARALYEAYPLVQGIRYSSSMHANTPAIALFERAAYALPNQPAMLRALGDQKLVNVVSATAEAIGYRWH